MAELHGPAPPMGLSVFTDGYSCHWRRLLLLFSVTLGLKRDALGTTTGLFPTSAGRGLLTGSQCQGLAPEASPGDPS